MKKKAVLSLKQSSISIHFHLLPTNQSQYSPPVNIQSFIYQILNKLVLLHFHQKYNKFHFIILLAAPIMPTPIPFRHNSLKINRKNDKPIRNSHSLYCHYGKTQQIYCGSILQIVKQWQKQRKIKQKLINIRMPSLLNEWSRVGCKQQQQKFDNFPELQSIVHQNSSPFQVKNVFRLKLMFRGQSKRKYHQKTLPIESVASLNVESKPMSNRIPNKFDKLQTIKKQPSPFNTFYTLRNPKQNQTLDPFFHSEVQLLQNSISPW